MRRLHPRGACADDPNALSPSPDTLEQVAVEPGDLLKLLRLCSSTLVPAQFSVGWNLKTRDLSAAW
jgi:hypothetical protein